MPNRKATLNMERLPVMIASDIGTMAKPDTHETPLVLKGSAAASANSS
jgi:hypothetical protein